MKTDTELLRLRLRLHFLYLVAEEYSGKTIDNIIQQMEARVKEREE